jgi:hypothetical protein
MVTVKLDEALFDVPPAPAMPTDMDSSPATAMRALEWLADYKAWGADVYCRLQNARAVNAGQPLEKCHE